MNDNEKEQQITEIQAKKKALQPLVQEAFTEKNIAFKTYNDLDFKWIDLRDQFEALDREEKLIFFSMPKNKTKTKKKMSKDRTKEAQENAKKTALKALNNLPPAMREQVLKQFK